MSSKYFSLTITFLSLVLFLSPVFSQGGGNETITLITYYPSPIGVYNEIRAKRMAVGDSYYDASQYCWFPDNCSNQIDGIGASCWPNCNTDLVVEGNVGIGTENPQYTLDVNGTSSFQGIINTNDNWISGDGDPEGIVIDTIGKVGIGTASPVEELQVQGSIKFGRNDNAWNNDWRLDTDSFPDRLAITKHNSGVYEVVIKNNGNVGIMLQDSDPSNILTIKRGSTTDPIADAWTTYSSRRWKTNIKPIENALDKVKKLRGVYFDWKKSAKHDIGMIAEEVGEVVPEVVTYEENGKDAKSLDYARLTTVLVEAVKEQQKEIEELRQEVNKLKKGIIGETLPH